MNVDVEITYSDLTLSETDGYYDAVSNLMASDRNDPPVSEWVIRSNVFIGSNVFIDSHLGFSQLEIQLHHDKSLYIIDYIPSSKDILFNPEIPAMSVWANERGWNIPEPSEWLCKSQKALWKHFWETRLINSPYYDELYGERETNYEEDSIQLEKERNEE